MFEINSSYKTIPQLLNEIEVSALIRKSIHWLRQDRITNCKIPFHKLGANVLYNIDDVAAYIGVPVTSSKIGGNHESKI